MSIQVDSIYKHYGNQIAVKDVSFRIESGEIVGFIGPNGAGKSTTMKIISGFLPPDSGQVLIKGMNVPDHQMEIKKIIGYLPENNPLYLEMYLHEYLYHVAGLYGIRRKQAALRIEEIIEITGLKAEQKKIIGNLSKGYRQRVGLAQALLHDPEVLILDEPTSGLDPNQIIEIRNLISTIGKEKTILLSTHLMQEVEAICDRVIIISQGEIVADEKAGNLTSYSTTGVQTVLLELNESVESSHLKKIPNIDNVRELSGNQYLLETHHNEDIRPSIFKFAVDQDITILSMSLREKSLEEVFQELTSS